MWGGVWSGDGCRLGQNLLLDGYYSTYWEVVKEGRVQAIGLYFTEQCPNNARTTEGLSRKLFVVRGRILSAGKQSYSIAPFV
jgi:hypothetical protein